MGHESQIELWSPNLTTFCFVGFGTDRLRRREAMQTADRENPTHGVTWPRNRAHGAVGQNRTSSIEWAEKQEKFQPKEKCFFLTSPFIELIGSWRFLGVSCGHIAMDREVKMLGAKTCRFGFRITALLCAATCCGVLSAQTPQYRVEGARSYYRYHICPGDILRISVYKH